MSKGQVVMPGMRFTDVAPCSRICTVLTTDIVTPLEVTSLSRVTAAIALSHGVTTHLPNELALKMDGA